MYICIYICVCVCGKGWFIGAAWLYLNQHDTGFLKVVHLRKAACEEVDPLKPGPACIAAVHLSRILCHSCKYE